jgi:ABC-2 type transport system ATP-binding protein
MSNAVLSIEHLSAHYGTRCVLTGIELTLATGHWCCLLGPNGSGKTTLLRCIGGQLTPTAGAVRIDTHSLLEAPERAKRRLGYGHPPDLLPALLTGRQCLEVYAAAHELSELGCATLDLAARLKLLAALEQPVSSYSLGMRQKLSVLLALVASPTLIVLDEAFNGLDPASALVLKRELHERVTSGKCAVLLATHALDIVSHHATHAALLLDGRLVRTWDRRQLDAIRSAGNDALDCALAQASQAHEIH